MDGAVGGYPMKPNRGENAAILQNTAIAKMLGIPPTKSQMLLCALRILQQRLKNVYPQKSVSYAERPMQNTTKSIISVR